jgi:hypothetical protein
MQGFLDDALEGAHLTTEGPVASTRKAHRTLSSGDRSCANPLTIEREQPLAAAKRWDQACL